MGEAILTAAGICKSYGLTASRMVTALEDVSVTLEKGRIYGLVGNNGSGKTTFMRIITGLVSPGEGELSLFGSETPAQLDEARHRVGALFEAPAYHGELSIRQNLNAQAMLFPGVTKEDLDELCELLRISKNEVGTTKIKNCSPSQRQRYGIASALLGEPELLLLDKPFTGLKPDEISEIHNFLRKLNSERCTTMLISSRSLSELYKLATDYIFLDLGRVIETISAEELEKTIAERDLRNVEDYFLELTRRSVK